MLGLLNPGRTDLKYRSLYSRCCQFQHLEYGVPSLLFHSFESVFLYAIAGDAGAVDTAKVPNQVCCRLRAGRRLEFAPDREVGRFCASFSLLAAETKSADALRDAPSLVAKTRDQLFQSRFRRARTYFSNLDTKFCSTFDGLIAEHLALENSSSMPSLATYCRPTAAAFEYTFGLMAKILSGSDLKPLPGASGFEHWGRDSRVRLREGLETRPTRRPIQCGTRPCTGSARDRLLLRSLGRGGTRLRVDVRTDGFVRHRFEARSRLHQSPKQSDGRPSESGRTRQLALAKKRRSECHLLFSLR